MQLIWKHVWKKNPIQAEWSRWLISKENSQFLCQLECILMFTAKFWIKVQDLQEDNYVILCNSLGCVNKQYIIVDQILFLQFAVVYVNLENQQFCSKKGKFNEVNFFLMMHAVSISKWAGLTTIFHSKFSEFHGYSKKSGIFGPCDMCWF